MHPRDACMCSSDSRHHLRSQRFVKAISQEPLIKITHDFVSRYLAAWPRNEKILVAVQRFKKNGRDAFFVVYIYKLVL